MANLLRALQIEDGGRPAGPHHVGQFEGAWRESTAGSQPMSSRQVASSWANEFGGSASGWAEEFQNQKREVDFQNVFMRIFFQEICVFSMFCYFVFLGNFFLFSLFLILCGF